MPIDQEKRFVSSLLRANEANQERFYLKQIPKGIFVVRSPEIEWLYTFRENHGQYPSIRAFENRWKYELPRVKDPIEATLQPILDLAMFEQMRRLQGRVKKLIDEGRTEKAMTLYKEGANKLTNYSTAYVDIALGSSNGARDRYRERVANALDPNNHILDSPWPTLNRVAKFFRPSEQIVISARSGLGKSWIVVQHAHYYAQKGIKVLVITKEMPAEQFEDRCEAVRYELPYEDFREGTLSPRQLRRWVVRKLADLRRAEDYPLIIVGTETIEGVGMSHIISKIQEHRPQVVFIDGAYLIRPDELPANISDTQRFTYLSNRFKSLFKFFNVLGYLTIQDNRNAEDKKGYSKGTQTTLYGADAWLQDSDWVFNIGGKRGTGDREIGLLKGRESNLVEFNVKFSLDPKPDFSDKGLAQKPAHKMVMKKFSGIK